MMDKEAIGVVIFAAICFTIAVGILGSLLAYDSVQEDCELLNAFRIRGEVYTCMREYHYNDYT
jgi:hypothetical protein